MKVRVYLKSGPISDIEGVTNIEYIDWYDEHEVWIYYGKDYVMKYKEKDIEEIKIRR